MSFSPKEKTGTRSDPDRIASFKNPNRRLRVRSFVPGRAERDSAAPPTTMVRHDPGPTSEQATIEQTVRVDG